MAPWVYQLLSHFDRLCESKLSSKLEIYHHRQEPVFCGERLRRSFLSDTRVEVCFWPYLRGFQGVQYSNHRGCTPGVHGPISAPLLYFDATGTWAARVTCCDLPNQDQFPSHFISKSSVECVSIEAWSVESRFQEMLTSDRLVQKVLDGKEQIVSTPGTSQYGYRGGVSACGLVCLNLARVIFQREQEHNVDILKVVMEKETAEVGVYLL